MARALSAAMGEMNGRAAMREVVWADALPWLRERPAMPGVCVVTSLPDVSETGMALAAWRAWFAEAARLTIEAAPAEEAAERGQRPNGAQAEGVKLFTLHSGVKQSSE